MTGGCNYPIYYQRVVSLDKGSVIIRWKEKNKLTYPMYYKRVMSVEKGCDNLMQKKMTELIKIVS
jgi:hypothetical protein